LTPRRASNACAVAALVNCALLAGTWWFGTYVRRPGFDWDESFWTRFVLVQFNLGSENVAATWYASMLLLVVAVLAILCFTFDRLDPAIGAPRPTSWGWLVVAVAFSALSVDEMVFVDERLGIARGVDPLTAAGPGAPQWVAVALAGLAAFLLLFACLHLRRVPWALPLMTIGLARFVSLPLYETLQGTAQAASDREIAAVLQGSAALFGTVCFLGATTAYLTARGSDAGDQRPSALVSMRAIVALMSGAVALLTLALLLLQLLPARGPETRSTGSAQDWPAAAAAVLVALACAHIHAEPRPTPKGGRTVYALVAVYSVAVSAWVGAAIHAYGHWKELYPLEVAVLAVIAGSALVLGVRLARRIDSNTGKAAAVGWAVATAAAFMGPQPWTPYLVFIANAVVLVSLPLHLDRRMRRD
jgi:hypothetical protein